MIEQSTKPDGRVKLSHNASSEMQDPFSFRNAKRRQAASSEISRYQNDRGGSSVTLHPQLRRTLSTPRNTHVTGIVFPRRLYRGMRGCAEMPLPCTRQCARPDGGGLLSEREIDSRKWCSNVPGPHRRSHFPIVSASDVEHAAE